MQLVLTGDVREGQTVARDVRDERGRILLARGQRLTASLIQRLFKFQVHGIYLRDGLGEEPELVKSEVREKCQEVLSDSFGKLAQVASAKRLTLDATAIQRATENLVDALMSNRNPLVTLLDINAGSDHLMQHSVSAAVLAVTLALDMGVGGEMVHHLATGMLFHDIGLLFLPDALLAKTALTPQDAQALRGHVRLGAAHLLQTQAVSSIAASIVLRHHETMDGSGYPDGFAGDKLSLLTRIACLAEVYDSLTSSRPYAPAVMPDIALTYILTNTNKLFAREVVLALSRRVALYPTGTAVQLNTGECGLVAGTPTLPTRPTVQILFDHKNRPLKSPVRLDLMQDGARYVVRSAAHLQALHSEHSRVIVPQAISPFHALG